MESKRTKLEENEDRLSALPDSLIHHILSLQPSTKEAIQTSILSKRWENQWTRVPDLIFDSTGMSPENFDSFVENTLSLHECSKINKFHLRYAYSPVKDGRKDPQFCSKIRFATRKSAKEISIKLTQEDMFPKFLFNNASLVKLFAGSCILMPYGKVNWECLTELSMSSCRLADGVMELILSGSPVLNVLSLLCCYGFRKLVIASKSLKIVCLQEIYWYFNLEVSCPQLEQLNLLNTLNIMDAKLLNLPSSVFASIDFRRPWDETDDTPKSNICLVKDVLQQVQHVKELRIGHWFMEILSPIRDEGLFSPVFNINFLSLDSHIIPGIAWLLCSFPMLEKLEIDVSSYDEEYDEEDDFGEKHWSDAAGFIFNVYNLKTIKFIGFLEINDEYKVMLNFVQFFLKNASVLEKMVVELKDDGTTFPFEIHQELLSLPRCSQCATIELLCSK